MIIGCVKELKDYENRVGLIPAHAKEYINRGHEVHVEAGLGLGSGFEDALYEEAGCIVHTNRNDVWEIVEMMIKVKEPVAEEYPLMKPGLILFTYLHLADNLTLTRQLLKHEVSAIAYETVRDKENQLPLLRPMSEVAGRLSIQEGSKYLEKTYGGKGILLSGVPGVRGGHVVVLGGGVVGMSACKTALGTGASVSVLDRNLDRLAYIEDVFNGRVETIYSDEQSLLEEIARADVIVGSVLLPGEKTPKLVRREHLKLMEPGTVLVDVAIDQGGCFETSRATTHSNPIFLDEGIVHYCVTNMPGAVPRTSTLALANATLPYGMLLANQGLDAALKSDEGFMLGLNTFAGNVCNKGVANALELEFVDYEKCVKTMQV